MYLLGTNGQSFRVQVSALDLGEQGLAGAKVELVWAQEGHVHFEQLVLLQHEQASVDRAIVQQEDMTPSPIRAGLIKMYYQLLEEPVERLAVVVPVVNSKVEAAVAAHRCNDVQAAGPLLVL